jgi:hypothetical protein
MKAKFLVLFILYSIWGFSQTLALPITEPTDFTVGDIHIIHRAKTAAEGDIYHDIRNDI